MFLISYRSQAIILVLWILIVIALFRFIPDKQIAATVAGIGFIIWPLLFYFAEVRSQKQNYTWRSYCYS